MKKCLIVVDYQVDFVTGSLGNAAAAALDAGIAARIRQARTQGEDVIFTLDTHETNYMQTREGKHLPVPHCIRGTEGHGLYGEVAAMHQPDDKVFCKETFGSRELFAYLQEKRYDAMELCGVVTNICVISNAVIAKTALPEAEVSVRAELCASNDEALHQQALNVMASFQVNII